MTIPVTVASRIATAQADAKIICGNSDYTVALTLDSEWDAYTAKTARFAYIRNGKPCYQDVLFEGDTVTIPPLYGVYEVAIGIYAGDIRTTTPARVVCMPCITDGEPVHDQPAPDVYNQLLAYLAQLSQGGAMPAGRIVGIMHGTASCVSGQAVYDT